ncbi:MAG: addiction module antidote protein, HigA family [Cupriavidus sp.]|nr:MAG: addiction module antidote protein, HigA family [Cupriavidus sp.]
MLDEIHPGEVLREDFMKPYGFSAASLASKIGLAPSSIQRLICGRHRLTARTAVRIGRLFNMEASFWANLQVEYDLRIARRESSKHLHSSVKPLAPKTPSGAAAQGAKVESWAVSGQSPGEGSSHEDIAAKTTG